jgi:AMMECR1 domain-containing protein
VNGFTVEAGQRRATLLPSVWPKVRDGDEFLGVLWAKAGLRPGEWPRHIAISRYTTVEQHDPGPRPAPRR